MNKHVLGDSRRDENNAEIRCCHKIEGLLFEDIAKGEKINGAKFELTIK